jgi:hypothetical protein
MPPTYFVRRDHLVTAVRVPVDKRSGKRLQRDMEGWGKLAFFIGQHVTEGWEVNDHLGITFIDTSLCASTPFVANPGDWIMWRDHDQKFLIYPHERFLKYYQQVAVVQAVVK